jgi:hypothetical protein
LESITINSETFCIHTEIEKMVITLLKSKQNLKLIENLGFSSDKFTSHLLDVLVEESGNL